MHASTWLDAPALFLLRNYKPVNLCIGDVSSQIAPWSDQGCVVAFSYYYPTTFSLGSLFLTVATDNNTQISTFFALR